MKDSAKATIIFCLILGAGLILINQTTSVEVEDKDFRDYGCDLEWYSQYYSKIVNSSVLITQESEFAPLTIEGDGESWETTYLINDTYFDVQPANYSLHILNTDAYVIFKGCWFEIEEKANVAYNWSTYLVNLVNVSNIRFQNCGFVGFDNWKIISGVRMVNCSNIEFLQSSFSSRFRTLIEGDRSNGLHFAKNRFSINVYYGYDYCVFWWCDNSTFTDNYISGSYQSSSYYGEYNFHGTPDCLELMQCANWTITENQFQYTDQVITCWDCRDIIFQSNYLKAIGGIDAAHFYNATYLQITDNIITYGGLTVQQSSHVEISRNLIHKAQSGIYAPLNYENISITHNRVQFSKFQAIRVGISFDESGDANTRIEQNTFFENGDQFEIFSNQAKQIHLHKNITLPRVDSIIGGIIFMLLCLFILKFWIARKKVVGVQGKIAELTTANIENTQDIPNLKVTGLVAVFDIACERLYFKLITGLILVVIMVIFNVIRKPDGMGLIELLNWVNGEDLYNVHEIPSKLIQSSFLVIYAAIGASGYRSTQKMRLILGKALPQSLFSGRRIVISMLPVWIGGSILWVLVLILPDSLFIFRTFGLVIICIIGIVIYGIFLAKKIKQNWEE